MDPFEEKTSNPEYSRFIHRSRYARYRDDLGRRETWEETVDRLVDFWVNRLTYEESPSYFFPKGNLNTSDVETIASDVREAIYNLDIMGSMRSLMTAGPALDRDNVAGYNCSYLPINSVRCFDELMYILLCGTGVGYSVERKYIEKLPEVAESFHNTDTTIVFSDSKIGWASGFRELLSLLYAGKIPKRDYSKIRPAGARLRTFGGRASGPEPLRDLCDFTVALFKRAAGRKLTSLECHDVCCKIADIVVVGGVRRSALISLSDLNDDEMRKAKSGQWWVDNPQRALANISAVYETRPSFDTFLSEWYSLYQSKSGERGIFSREAACNQVERNGRREVDHEWGTNPCSEILLRPFQFCNLTEVVVRPDDTLDTLKKKVRLATIVGTLQSTLVDFRYLRRIWKRNTEEERLLGVSLTGIMDHSVLGGRNDRKKLEAWLDELRQTAVETNKEWAEKLGINPSAAITCVKPSGTVSQLVDSASGIHPRYARHYLRTVRADKKDPLAQFMIDKGFYYEEDAMNPHNYVFYFPMKSPDAAILADEMESLEQLELWKVYQDHWCEHKPSMTCYYTDDSFLDVGAWVWHNLDKISGVSFLPYSDHVYKQAPYIPVDEDTYNEWLKKMPQDVDWLELSQYEQEDNTTGQQELACVAGACEI